MDKDGKYSDKKTLGRKNQIILNDVNGSAPYLELEYVKDEVATTSASEKDEDAARNLETKNAKAGDSESKGAEAEKQKDPMKNCTGFSHMGRKIRTDRNHSL